MLTQPGCREATPVMKEELTTLSNVRLEGPQYRHTSQSTASQNYEWPSYKVGPANKNREVAKLLAHSKMNSRNIRNDRQ